MWIRWRRPVLVAGVLLALGAILFMARGALFPFIISLVLAELLYPAVKFLETRLPGHRRAPTVTRVVSIMAIYIVFAGCLVGVAYLTIPPLFAEAQHFIRTFPEFYERARTTVEGWSENLTAQIPQDILVHIEGAVASGGDVLAEAAQGVITRTLSGASSTLTIVIGLAIVPFLLFYLLKDREEITSGMYASMSPRSAMHLRNVLNVLSRVIGAYVRAQILSACNRRSAGVHRPEHTRNRVRGDARTGGWTVRTHSHHRPLPGSGSRNTRDPVTFAGQAYMGRAGVRRRPARGEQSHIAPDSR